MNLLSSKPSLMPKTWLMISSTNRCNSKCKICSIWQEKPKKDLPLEAIKNLLDSKYVDPDKTSVTLTGGEFILHPRRDEIIDEVKSRGFNFTLLTNGLLPEIVEKCVREHKIKAVQISLDGKAEAYKIIRGVDGYSRVIETIKRLHNRVDLTLTYVITKYNTVHDFLHVLDIAKKYGCRLQALPYEDAKIFRTDFEGRIDPKVVEEISQFVEDKMNRLYLKLYPQWLEGNLRVPCLSIRSSFIVMPNGDVPLCHCTNIKLGNILEQPLDKIWTSKRTIELLKKYTRCNLCWALCHRIGDLSLLTAFWEKLKFLPKPMKSAVYRMTAKSLGDYSTLFKLININKI